MGLLTSLIGDGDSASSDATSGVPITATSTAAYALPTTGTTWTDVDNGGSASARPLDIVIPSVEDGDDVEVGISAVSYSASLSGYVRVATIVSGSVVTGHHAQGWTIPQSVTAVLAGSIIVPVVTGDIEGGSVRLRVQFQRLNGSAARNIGESDVAMRVWGRGPWRG